MRKQYIQLTAGLQLVRGQDSNTDYVDDPSSAHCGWEAWSGKYTWTTRDTVLRSEHQSAPRPHFVCVCEIR